MGAGGSTATVIAGALAAGYLISAAFFLRFWGRTRDGLFAAFAAAFGLLCADQALPSLMNFARDEQRGLYLLRLGAFVLIILAILAKNLAGRSGPGSRKRHAAPPAEDDEGSTRRG